jgi:hypothetical protein
MSIHIYIEKIKEMLSRQGNVKYNVPDDQVNSIVATGIKGKKPHILKIDDYTEDNLIALIIKNNEVNHYKHLYVDYRFWNYRYCSPENLQTENLKYMMEIAPSDEPYIETHMFYVGMVTVTIMYYSIIYHSLIAKNDLFKNYMSLINIDRNDFSRFLTQSYIYFPLTENYLTLIKRVFTDETIGEYLFHENGPPYSYIQVREILSFFNVRDIRYYVKLIYDMDESLENKYHYLDVIFDSLDGSIDDYKKVFATDEMDFKPVGYYLEELRPDTVDLDNLYEELVKKYSLLGGAEDIEIF